MGLHKNDLGAYTIMFFDKHGRRIKSLEVVGDTLQKSIDLGKESVETSEEIVSFLVKRTVYNSIG